MHPLIFFFSSTGVTVSILMLFHVRCSKSLLLPSKSFLKHLIFANTDEFLFPVYAHVWVEGHTCPLEAGDPNIQLMAVRSRADPIVA